MNDKSVGDSIDVDDEHLDAFIKHQMKKGIVEAFDKLPDDDVYDQIMAQTVFNLFNGLMNTGKYDGVELSDKIKKAVVEIHKEGNKDAEKGGWVNGNN